MDSMTLPDRSPSSLKRSLPMDSEQNLSPSGNISTTPSPLDFHRNDNGLSRHASPALSSTTTLTSLSATPPPPAFGRDGTIQPAEPRAKKRKLTFAEKEQQNIDKEHRRIEKAQRQAQKEQEKLMKDEEKRQKAELREAKQREKDLEKERKEQEKAKKEEEKAKKNKAQMRLTGFFQQPLTPVKQAASAQQSTCSGSPFTSQPNARRNLVQESEIVNDYKRTFLPFALPTQTTCAPPNLATWDESATLHIEHTVEQAFRGGEEEITIPSLQESLGPIHAPKRRLKPPTVKSLVGRISGTEESPIDLMGPSDPLDILRQIPRKTLTFHEDVRPPYIGTYSKDASKRLFRNPFAQSRTDTDYDYDSEAEWEEPEEGEDIDIEDESDGEAASEMDDMDDFLDDQDDGGPIRKRILVADLEPVSSGVCWENSDGVCHDENGTKMEYRVHRLEVLLEALDVPIDPFSSAYWPLTEKSDSVTNGGQSTASMNPPARPPLQSKSTGALNGTLFGTIPKAKVEKAPKTDKASGPPKLLTGEEFEAFKRAVNGSDDTKPVLLGMMKKQFPKVTNAVLNDTLKAVAVKRKEDKKWILL